MMIMRIATLVFLFFSLVISLVELRQYFACLKYVSITMQGNQTKFETLIAGNNRNYKAYEPLP